MTRRRTARATFALAVTIASFSSSIARANGRYPAANQLLVDPGDPTHIVVRATYGLLQSMDSGGAWVWDCEKAIGFNGAYDPPVAVTADGSIFVGTFTGLSATHDRACDWAFTGAPLDGKYVIDVSTDKAAPHTILALSTNGSTPADAGADAAETFLTIVAESKDDGRTWAAIGTSIPDDFVAETIDSAESDPKRLYVTGTVGQPHVGYLERSDDRGATWTRLPIDLHGGDAPYLAAIDPNDPDRLYVRIDAAGTDPLLMSTDGGHTFTLIFTSKSPLLGFALSPDGSSIAVGSATDGILVAPSGAATGATPAFAPASTVGAACLTWTSAGLYACGREYPDGFTVGVSTDQGKTFTDLDHLSDLEPLACPADSGTGNICPDEWPDAQATIGQEIEAGVVETSVGDAGSDASTDSAGSGGNGASGGCVVGADRDDRSDDARISSLLGAIATIAFVRRKKPLSRSTQRRPSDP